MSDIDIVESPKPNYDEYIYDNIGDDDDNRSSYKTVRRPAPDQESFSVNEPTLHHGQVFEDEDPKTMKEVGTLNTYGIIINAIIGTGFFSVPYTYYASGIILAVSMTIFCGVFTMLGGAWSIENTCRARGYDTARKYNVPYTSAMNIYTFRQIEFSEMAQIFSGQKGLIFCQIIFGMYALGSLWAYVSMFASTSANILMKYVVHDSDDCIIETNPSAACHRAYLGCLVFFLVCCLIMELFHMSKLAFIQTFFTIYRFVAFFLIMVACLISISNNGAYWLHPTSGLAEDADWARFKWSGFPGLFSATSFALNCAYNLPSILTPMKRPKTHALHAAEYAMLTAAIIYIFLSILLSFTLGEDSLQYIILNFARYGSNGFQRMDDDAPVPHNMFSVIVKFLVMCFPMLNMISSFPLVCGSVAYNFYSCVPESFKIRFGNVGPVLMKYALTIPAFILGALVPTLGIIVKFCGLSASFLIIFIPAYYQYRSKRICGTEWHTPYSGWWSDDRLVYLALGFGAFALGFSIYQFLKDPL